MDLLSRQASFLEHYFIPPSYRTSAYLLKKAKLFVLLPITIIVISLFCILLSWYLGDYAEMPFIVQGSIVCLIPLWLFKKYGSMFVAGNLLTAIYAITVGESVFRTGGLYSDNLLWLMLVPMMSMLFSGKNSGFVWLLLLSIFTFYVYSIEPGGPDGFRELSHAYDNKYYLTSYLLLFVSYTLVVSVFVAGSKVLSNELLDQKKQSQLKTIEATQKADALEKAEASLLAKNRELEQFAYAAAHDLREPLRMISAYTTLLRRRLGGQLDEGNKEFLDFAIDGANRMDIMLNDLLEFAKLGHDGEKAVQLDLNLVVKQAAYNLTLRIQETSTQINCDTLPNIFGAETQLVRLFQNLMSNAIKFARPGVHPQIHIHYQPETGHPHLIYFKDNGIGIPPAAHERIFNVFERLNSRSEYEGSGIGLASCKKIVDNLGGTIAVADDTSHVGTVFKLCFPIQQAMAEPQALGSEGTTSVDNNRSIAGSPSSHLPVVVAVATNH